MDFSLYKSDGWDNTKDALREPNGGLKKLSIERRMVVEETTHADEISRMPRVREEGWIVRLREKELRRIPFLARARNRVLKLLSGAPSCGLGEEGRNGALIGCSFE